MQENSETLGELFFIYENDIFFGPIGGQHQREDKLAKTKMMCWKVFPEVL